MKRCLRIFLVSICVLSFSFGLFVTFREVVAECISLASYTSAKDADRYMCLPRSGENFSSGSLVAHAAGRYFLKGRAAATILEAYADLAKTHPENVYVYGECGLNGGGNFRPHRTHKEGLTADFMTPVYIFEKGRKQIAVLPTNATNMWGYGIRFDTNGRSEQYILDVPAMIAHLSALATAAHTNGLYIKQVIFDPPLLALLKKDPTYSSIRSLSFMKGKAWFPHDGHYHIDFGILPQ